VCCLKIALITNCDRTTSGRGFVDQDHLEQFSVKQEHNQHTWVQYHISKFKYKLLQIRFTFLVYKKFEAKRHFKRYLRVCGCDFSHVQYILFALEENVIHQRSKPDDPSMVFNPPRFGPPTNNPHRHRQKEEAAPHLYIVGNKSKAWATTFSKTYPQWSKDHH
jgi:hypothetical protein